MVRHYQTRMLLLFASITFHHSVLTATTGKHTVTSELAFVEIWNYINLKKIIGNPNFSDLFKRIVHRFKRAGYTLDIMRQTPCLVFNPIMVRDHVALFRKPRR